MKKLLIIGPLSVLAVSCSTVNQNGSYRHTMSYDSDTKGAYTFPEKRAGSGRKVFIFDPKLTAWAAYDAQGNRIQTGRASGGADFCEDIGRSCRTVTGKYRVYSKKDADCRSSKYPIETNGGARMPYCMHFHGGYSIHAAYDVPNYNASHGCIRVLPSAAQWLNQNFIDVGTTVEVRSY